MSRPLVEMADIVRCAGQAFIEHSRRWINWQHRKVLLAITRCRTAALGGHRDRCTGCGHTTAILGLCTCFGTHADPLSQLAETPLPPVVPAAARHRCATSRSSVPHSTGWIMPCTMTSSSLRTRPDPFKIHSPPWGRLPSSRCIRSALYEGVQTRASVQGAPDTALRRIRTNIPCGP